MNKFIASAHSCLRRKKKLSLSAILMLIFALCIGMLAACNGYNNDAGQVVCTVCGNYPSTCEQQQSPSQATPAFASLSLARITGAFATPATTPLGIRTKRAAGFEMPLNSPNASENNGGSRYRVSQGEDFFVYISISNPQGYLLTAADLTINGVRAEVNAATLVGGTPVFATTFGNRDIVIRRMAIATEFDVILHGFRYSPAAGREYAVTLTTPPTATGVPISANTVSTPTYNATFGQAFSKNIAGAAFAQTTITYTMDEAGWDIDEYGYLTKIPREVNAGQHTLSITATFNDFDNDYEVIEVEVYVERGILSTLPVDFPFPPDGTTVDVPYSAREGSIVTLFGLPFIIDFHMGMHTGGLVLRETPEQEAEIGRAIGDGRMYAGGYVGLNFASWQAGELIQLGWTFAYDSPNYLPYISASLPWIDFPPQITGFVTLNIIAG